MNEKTKWVDTNYHLWKNNESNEKRRIKDRLLKEKTRFNHRAHRL